MADHKQMLHHLLEDIAQEQNYKNAVITIQPTSSDGANFSSVLYNIEISAPDKKQLQLFAKVANISEKIREDVPAYIFDTERFVYRDLAEIFKKMEQKREVPEEHRFVLPKFYGYNPNIYEETIVMEDLAAQGYIVYDRLKSVDWPYASKAVETLAKFHALAMAYEEDNPEEYGKLLKKLADQIEPIYKTMSGNFKHFVKIALLATREENKERLRKYFDREIALGGNIFSRYYKPKRKPVIIHSDFRPSNIMHRVNEMVDKLDMLHQLLAGVAKEQNYKDAAISIQPASTERANYMSVLYNITISSPDKKPLQLFAKVANINEKHREYVPQTTFTFEVERFVYRDLAKIFKKMEQKREVPEEHRYVLPKFYGYNPNIYEETIVMEDLAAHGYIVYDRLKSVDWPYASKAAEILAKFHALSMAYGEENPEEYDKLLKKISDQIKPIYKTVSDTFEHFVKVALLATRKENKERLQKYFDREIARGGNIFSRYYKPKRKPVIIHTDFQRNNIMHQVNEDGSLDLVLLDYQTIQAGCGVSDLLFFIFSGSDAEFRAKYYQRLVDHYYENLVQALKRLRLDPEKIYPKEDFDYELQEALPYGLISAILLLPTATALPQDAPDLNQDSFEALANVKTSSLYPERINGVIDDYVRWGIL